VSRRVDRSKAGGGKLRHLGDGKVVGGQRVEGDLDVFLYQEGTQEETALLTEKGVEKGVGKAVPGPGGEIVKNKKGGVLGELTVLGEKVW